MGTPWDNPYEAPMGTPWDNPYKGPGKYEQAETDYWSDKQVINTPGGEIVIDSQGNEVVDTPNVPMGTPWDNPYQAPDATPKKGIMQSISDFFFTPAGAAEISPIIGGDAGLGASGKLGNLSATIDVIDALKGESIDPQFNYNRDFGNTNVYGNYSDNAQNIGLNFNNDKGLSGGISYDVITGKPRFDIKKTFADGGLASMFTRRG